MAVLKPIPGTDYFLWKFVPSRPASIALIFVFLVTTILHLWRIYKFRSYFCIAFTLGCLCEVLGYATRVVAYDNTDSIAIYAVQSSFLVLAPVFFAASIYMTLGRIIRCVKGEHLSIIRLTRITKTFVWGDFFTLGIQGGAVNLTTKDKTAKLGENLVVVGLCMQLALLGFFFLTAAVFHKRLRKQPTIESTTTNIWKSTLYMIYVVSALIFLRSVFRVIEFLQGTDGYSLRNEWTLYVFDAAPMFVVTLIYFWWYPGFLLQTQEGEERFELVEEGRVKSDRPLIRS